MAHLWLLWPLLRWLYALFVYHVWHCFFLVCIQFDLLSCVEMILKIDIYYTICEVKLCVSVCLSVCTRIVSKNASFQPWAPLDRAQIQAWPSYCWSRACEACYQTWHETGHIVLSIYPACSPRNDANVIYAWQSQFPQGCCNIELKLSWITKRNHSCSNWCRMVFITPHVIIQQWSWCGVGPGTDFESLLLL